MHINYVSILLCQKQGPARTVLDKAIYKDFLAKYRHILHHNNQSAEGPGSCTESEIAICSGIFLLCVAPLVSYLPLKANIQCAH